MATIKKYAEGLKYNAPRYTSVMKHLDNGNNFNSPKSKSMKKKILYISHDLIAIMFFLLGTTGVGLVGAQIAKCTSSWLELSSGWSLGLVVAIPMIMMSSSMLSIACMVHKFFGSPHTKFMREIVKES